MDRGGRFRIAFVAFAAGTASAALASANTNTDRELETRVVSRVHVVAEGETLWNISRIYGCMPADLRQRNDLADDLIHPGLELRIPRCASDTRTVQRTREVKPNSRAMPGSVMTHTVAAGDSLFKIAQAYGCTVDDIRVRNRLTDDTIYPGVELAIVPGAGRDGRAIPGQCVGKAHAGKLVGGTRLPAGQGYFIRRPDKAWGANHTVHNVRKAIELVRARHGKLHALAIGDLSARAGGKIPEHRSHQSGRDVDVGFFFSKRPRNYPAEFAVATAQNLNYAATFELVATFAAMADADNGVERIFLGYNTQRLLYRWAERNGVPPRELGRMFQYPHGAGAATGIVRHEPNHDDHLHVRFKCPPGDRSCE